jgi:hypothetical protein
MYNIEHHLFTHLLEFIKNTSVFHQKGDDFLSDRNSFIEKLHH